MSVSLVPSAAPAPLDPTLARALTAALAQVNSVVLGKAAQVKLAFACLLAGGHLLIEDLPGVGKTTLAHALAATLGLGFARIQFTADLLPSDIIGVGIYERGDGAFKFHPGPLFASSCSPTRSTARRRRHKVPCSRRWPSTRSPPTG